MKEKRKIKVNERLPFVQHKMMVLPQQRLQFAEFRGL